MAFLCCRVAFFGFFCRCRGFYHRPQSDLFLVHFQSISVWISDQPKWIRNSNRHIYVMLHLRIKVLHRALIDFLIIAYDNIDWIFQGRMEYPVKLMYIVFMAVLSLPVTDAYSRGAPLSACGSMMPRHGSAVPQTSPSPYTITLNATSYSPNDVIEGNAWLW